MEHEDRVGGSPAAAIDPIRLVREYVKRDANGERLRSNPWFEEVVTWPQDPGYDSYTVIRGYVVEPPPTIHGSPARILVRYDGIGWVVPDVAGSSFLPQWQPEALQFVVVHDDEGWRIDSPQIDQHVLAEVAASRGSLTPDDAALIRALAAEAPPKF